MKSFHQWFVERESIKDANTISKLKPGPILEIGCGLGLLSDRLHSMGFDVTKTDYNPEVYGVMHVDAHCPPFENDSFDLIVCSNVLEHLKSPSLALRQLMLIGRRLWISWTPWFSPFGGHDFSPWHYFGRTKGRHHQLGINLFRVTVADAMMKLDHAGWRVIWMRPRYYPRLAFLARWRWTREWATWNMEILCERAI